MFVEAPVGGIGLGHSFIDCNTSGLSSILLITVRLRQPDSGILTLDRFKVEPLNKEHELF